MAGVYGSSGASFGGATWWGGSEEPRALLVAWVEGELPVAARRLRVSWVQGEVPLPARTLRVSWAELELGEPERTLRVSAAFMLLADPPQIGEGIGLLVGREFLVTVANEGE